MELHSDLLQCHKNGLIQLDVNISSIIVCASIFPCSFHQNAMYYCTALSAVLDWICALQVFIIIIIIMITIIIIIINEKTVDSSR